MINTVKQLATGYLVNELISVPNEPKNRHYKAVQQWISEGNTPAEEFTAQQLAQKLTQQKISHIEQAIQRRLDDRARLSGYDNINSIGKYLGYPNAYKAECEMLGAWLADTWVSATQILTAWQEGGEEPSTQDVLNALPPIP